MNSKAYAKPISSTELIEHAKEYDGKMVIFQGEAVGEVMRRGAFAWVNLNDGANALGIWLPISLASAITFTGGYKTSGDIIEIRGTFHRACLQHGGDLDIHAEELTVVKKGCRRQVGFDVRKKYWVFILAGISVCLLILRVWLAR
ncbi:MAG: DNA-binding protein [Candidatus Omnitrophota bacterium]